jgi:hypothetical protein
MKRILMLNPINCGSADTKKGKIYEVLEDVLNVWDLETDDTQSYEYSIENVNKYAVDGKEITRWITINDESSNDTFQTTLYNNDEEDFIIFENDNELAHGMINRIDGLATTITNMTMLFMK